MLGVQKTHVLNKGGHDVRSPLDGKTVRRVGTFLYRKRQPRFRFYADWIIIVIHFHFHMSKTRKKAREEFWLTRFQAATQLRFQIEDEREIKEQPDFLIRYQERIVGVEIAELQIDRDKGSSKGSTLQKEYSLQQSVVSRTKELYFAINNRPINAQVCFWSGPGQSLQLFNRRDLAERIAESLSQVNLGPFDRQRLDLRSDPALPPPVAFINVRGLPSGITPRWQVVASGWSKEFQSSDVESLLSEKNALISQYRRTVMENWLVIIADGGKPPGMFRPPKQAYSDLPASNFDRTFLLCEPDRFLIEWPQTTSTDV